MKSLHDAGHTAEELRDALASLGEIKAFIAGRSPAFFLDFDGTLAPIVPRPDQVELPAGRREVLRRLGEKHPVCIVSGRDLDDLRNRVGLAGLYYAGDHGFRITGPSGTNISLEVEESAREILTEAATRAQELLGDIPGVIVEAKVLSLSIHYRLVSPKDLQVIFTAVQTLHHLYPALRLTTGKCVFEFRPSADWGKGKAISWLSERICADGREICPICVGDDATDEDMFLEVEEWGVSVVVGKPVGSTHATFILETPADTEIFLARFLE
jgi:trehalose-phosphatase